MACRVALQVDWWPSPDMRVPALLFSMLATAACVSCSPDASRLAGPLDVGGGEGAFCIPAATGRDYSYGFDALSNTGPDAITITSVELVRARGVRIVEAYVLP